MALCNVTGTVYMPNGDVASRREVVFYKLPDNVTADYLGAVVPEPIIVRTDSSGDLDVNLITGNYYGHVQSRNGKEKYPFRAIVPEAATADFADLITAVDPVEPLPAWLQQAIEARDEARAAADDARSDKEAVEALLLAESMSPGTPPKFHPNGGQIARLVTALNDPLYQKLGIVFIGDSITWGRTLPDNAPFDPRDGTLSDPRDYSTTASWVNIVKGYIGEQYSSGSTPVLTNWPASPSGTSTATYSSTYRLFPSGNPFASFAGASSTVTEVASASSLLGYQLRLSHGSLTNDTYASLTFRMTGDAFTLVYSAQAGSGTYRVYSDGALIGTYDTEAVDPSAQNRRVHTIPFVRNGEIEIRTFRRPEQPTGIKVVYIEAIEINKQIRLTNQGINGATTRSYLVYNLSGSFDDGVAVLPDDSFMFMQLGANDRIARADTPGGSQAFRKNLNAIADNLIPRGDLILMCSNPSVTNSLPSFSFSMADAKATIGAVAAERNLDMIDNYAVFSKLTLANYLVDDVHPNALGHALIAKNIIGAISQA